MKKIISMILVIVMALGLAACGGGNGAAAGANGGNNSNVFMAGFGMQDITPKDSVPMASYGYLRFSDGLYSYLEARAVAVKDANGDLLIFAVGDVSWCPANLGGVIKDEISGELGIPKQNIILSGTHTHASVDTGATEYASVGEFNKRYIAGMKAAIVEAVEDLKPAEVYVGSVMTEGMNFVRRYIMDDGSLCGDNAYGTGTVIDRHETQADGELQLMRFVREGGKDILISNFQAHPHLEGKTSNLSSQTPGAIRDAVEKNLDAHSLHWQGAAGNLNSRSRISEENKYTAKDRVKYGEDMCKYIETVYDSLTKVESGPVKVIEIVYEGKVNHAWDHMATQAKIVDEYFTEVNDAGKAAQFAWTYGLHSGYHARRILGNAKLGPTQNLTMVAWSFGDVGGVVNAFEMFDTTGMYIKENSPFARTFIVGYSYPGGGGYIPTKDSFDRGGYEADNCIFEPGTAELIADQYLSMLEEMHG